MVIFEQYQTLLEGHIDRLISECGCTPAQFQEALQKNYDGDTPLYLDIILGAADFVNFVMLMREYKTKINESREEAREKANPSGDTGGQGDAEGEDAQ